MRASKEEMQEVKFNYLGMMISTDGSMGEEVWLIVGLREDSCGKKTWYPEN